MVDPYTFLMVGLGVVSPDKRGLRTAAPTATPLRTTTRPAPAVTPIVGRALDLQRTAGNRAVTQLLQRKKTKPPASYTPSKAQALQSEFLAMNLDWILKGQASPEDVAGLTDLQLQFVTYLSQAITGRRFGGRERVNPEARELDWSLAQVLYPVMIMQLWNHPNGVKILPRLKVAMAKPASEIIRDAMLVRAARAGSLAEALSSPKAKQARASALDVLKSAQGAYGKVNGIVEGAVEASGHKTAQVGMGRAWEGLQLAQKLATATDPATYKTFAKEAAEWQAVEGGRSSFEVAAKTVEVEAQIIDLTVGTVQKVTDLLAGSAMSVLGKGGDLGEVMTELRALQSSGQLVGKAGSAALKIGKVAEKLASLGKVLNGIQIVGGVAKLINAESKFEKIDAGVDIAAGGMSLAGSVMTGAAAAPLAMTGGAIGLTWGMVKVIGGEAIGAIEGSQYGGLFEELREIEKRGATVVSSVAALDTAIAEQTKQQGGPGAAGADEAVADLARKLASSMLALDKRWQNSSIKALQKFSPVTLRQEIMNAQSPDYPPDLTSSTGHELVQELGRAYAKADVIVVDMLVELGYFSQEKAKKVKAKLAKG